MKIKKYIIAGLAAVICILLNLGGKAFADWLELPVVLDTIGTMMAAIVYGPGGGIIVGIATNFVEYLETPLFMLYAISDIATAVVVSVCAKHKPIDSFYRAISIGFMVTVVSVAVSSPINAVIRGGMTGNKWGDGVVSLLLTNGVFKAVSYPIGQFYVDFVDKIVCVLLIYAVLKLYRKFGTKRMKEMVAGLLSTAMSAVLCLGLCGTEAAAESSDTQTGGSTYIQTIYNAENGLTGGAANAIAQTKDGVLWIGTYGGLYRYSGTEFKWRNDFESVKNVNCLFTDEEGRLWIGTNDGGISICVDNEVTNVLNHYDGLPSDSVRCIAQSSDGYYYVGTSDALAIVTLTNGLTVTDRIDEIKYARSISVGDKYTAVVNDEGMLFLLDGTQIVAKSFQEKYSSCSFTDDGLLYAGTRTGEVDIYNVLGGNLTLTKIIHCGDLAAINSIEVVAGNYLILCAENGAGYIDDKEIYSPVRLNKFTSCVDHVLVDYQGNLWFTSSRLGLLKMSRSPFNEIYNQVNMEPAVVNSVIEWNGVMYIGTDDGLDVVNYGFTKELNNSLTQTLEGVRIRSLMADSKDNLWICTSDKGTLCVGKDMMTTFYSTVNGLIGNKTRNTLELSNGDILIAEDLGITCIRNGKVEYNITQTDGLDIPKVLCMTENRGGAVLAGTDGGGIAVIENGKVTDIIDDSNGLTSGVVMRVVPDKSGVGWFIVTSNSLCYMDSHFRVRPLTNFPYYNNYDVIERDDGLLFVPGSAGIYVMDKATLLSAGTDHTLLDYSKGLRVSFTANAWNYCDDAGNLYLATDSGVVSLNLYNYELTMRSYRMSLSSVQADDDICKSMDGETFSIPRGVQRIVFTPDIINYSLNNPYVSIYLEGFDASPKIKPLSSLSEEVYTNIPTGTYIFRMAVLDEKGEVSSETSYTIIKEKEIYDEVWFKIYVLVVMIAAIVYFTLMMFKTQVQRIMNVQKRELEVAKRQIEMGNEAIMTIARTVDAKDMNTSQHSFRVSEYSLLIAKRLGMDEEECEELRKTALLHDIGKIGIPDSVLNKPAKLTDEEYAIMKSHVVKGKEILEDFSGVKNIVEGARYHHERYDGKGYVEGLKGEEIPLNARIIGIADAFDAMTANRVYRKRLEIDVVIDELKRCRGTQFDPKLTDIMLDLIDDGTIQVEKLYEESQGATERRELR